MRSGFLLLTIVIVGGSGCTLARNAVHNLANETVAHWDEKKLSRQLRAEAEAAWAVYCPQAGGALSEDFAAGFRDGYADFLESGGNGSPPAVPPLRYRRSGYLNPEGHARIRDYFAGFKVGADTAAASGHREYLTVPVLLSDEAPPATLPGVQLPAAQSQPPSQPPVMPPPAGPPVRAGERLPAPLPLDPATGLPVPNRPLVQPPPQAPPPLPIPGPSPAPARESVPEAPRPDPLRPVIPVPPPPQTRQEVPLPAEPREAVSTSGELPTMLPGTPVALPPVTPPDIPSVRRSIDR